ncbi:MAG: DUF4465 domain-containing protein [Saprospiraceae bacterium]|nr:DUF4465 domain-containing protein [Saprospiraceae bacterium]
MKTYLFFLLFFLTKLLFAQTIADFEEYELSSDTFNNGSDGSGGFISGNIFLPNDYSLDFNAWLGWALSSKKDTMTPGFFNQYSCIAGSGNDSSQNYAVAFALEPATLKLVQGPKRVSGLYICNGTYPYLSMRDGDSFSKKFGGPSGNDPDFFIMTVKKFSNGLLSTDSINFYLADFRSDNSDEDYIISDWTYLDLSPLGEADSLQFNLFSSDNGIFGMNTPAYFCIDQIVTEDLSTSLSSTIQDQVKLDLFPNPATTFVQISAEKQLNPVISIYDQTGKMMQTATLIEGRYTLDVQDYLPGLYYVVMENNTKYISAGFIKQ